MTVYRPKAAPITIQPYTDNNRQYLVHDSDETNFILTEAAGVMVLKLLDGQHSLADIQRQVQEAHGVSLSETRLQAFLDMCGENNLLEANSWRVTERQNGGGIWKNLGFYRILVSTERFSGWLHAHRWLWWNPVTGLLMGLLMAAGLLSMVTVSSRSAALTMDTLTAQAYQPIFMFLPLLMLLSIALHELGHTLACAYYNVKSRGWGFGLLWGVLPIFFTDTAGAYTIQNKYKRAMISLAGPLVDLMLLGACYLLLFWLQPGSDGYRMIAMFSLFPLSMIFINLNPFLIRLDGYWIVVDLLEKPNLRSSALRYMKTRVRRWFRLASQQEIHTVEQQLSRNPRLRWIYPVYFGVATIWTLLFATRFILGVLAMLTGGIA